MNKKITIELKSGEVFESTKGEVNFNPWGITALIAKEEHKVLYYIPWTNIDCLIESSF